MKLDGNSKILLSTDDGSKVPVPALKVSWSRYLSRRESSLSAKKKSPGPEAFITSVPVCAAYIGSEQRQQQQQQQLSISREKEARRWFGFMGFRRRKAARGKECPFLSGADKNLLQSGTRARWSYFPFSARFIIPFSCTSRLLGFICLWRALSFMRIVECITLLVILAFFFPLFLLLFAFPVSLPQCFSEE